MNKPADYPRISAIICALNEEMNLPHVLPKIPQWVDEVILVDGHSTDNTIAKAREILPHIKVHSQPGRGKGDALKYGVEQANGDIIVTLDADGETPPEEMDHFIQPLLDGYDLAKGSRLFWRRPHRMPRYRWLGNKILVLTCNVLFGTRFSDICSGYNAFRREVFLQLDLPCDVKERGCSMEQRMIVRAKKAGMKVKEVPHTSNGRIGGSSVLSTYRQSARQGFRDWLTIMEERFISRKASRPD
jgi:glycosyltransferase involved in cell wall biosynthesis